MLTKEKQFTDPTDPRIRAGEDAEKEMASRLQRRFGNDTTVHIINDLRIEHGGNAFQIDHLLVTPWGLFIIESKSVHCPVTIKVWDEKREHWSRNFSGTEEGFDSPVLQAAEQARLLKEFLRANSEKMLGKMIGLMQKGFTFCPIVPLVAISATGVIKVESGTLHKSVLKADEIAPEIAEQIAQLKKKARFFNPSLDAGWDMSEAEAERVASFLANAHTPKKPPLPTSKTTSASSRVAADSKPSSIPRAGAPCPACGTQKLVRKSVKHADGTETDFLACAGYPKECPQIFALVSQALNTTTKPETDGGLQQTTPVPEKGQRRPVEKNYCYQCKADIPGVVAKYCFDRPKLFGGRAFCRSCQDKLTQTRHTGQ